MSRKNIRPNIRIDKLSKFRPQQNNANRHTERGMGMLDASMTQDGFFDGMTAAADGEIIDGSARLEVSATKFADEAIILEHDGTRPIIEVRTDIPNAQDPRAKRIALAANRVAQVNLKFDPDVLKSLEEEIDLSKFWNEEEFNRLIPPSGFDLQEFAPSEAEQGTGAGIGAETRIAVVVPPEDYEVARKSLLKLMEEHPTWDVRFPK